MGNKNKHVGKSESQKRFYKSAINQTDYEQTAEEQLDFDSSDSPRNFNPNEQNVQKQPFKYKAQSYFEEHKFEVIMTIITAICIPVFVFYAITLNRESGQHEKQIESIEKSVTEIKDDIKSESEIINQLRIAEAESAKDLEYIKYDMEQIKNKLEKLETDIKNRK